MQLYKLGFSTGPLGKPAVLTAQYLILNLPNNDAHMSLPFDFWRPTECRASLLI